MTVADPEADIESGRPRADSPDDRPAGIICPYLIAADGTWRSATVAREHRCGAVAPPAPLTGEKQRRLCLTVNHRTCATYEAARATRPLRDRATTLPRPLSRTAPIVLDHGRIAFTIPVLRTDRSNGQAALIALMALAFAAIVLAKLTGGGTAAGAVDSGSSPAATAAASPAASGETGERTPAPTTDGGSLTATAGPDGASSPPASEATRTYRVQSGDTLIGIAAKFGTTTKAITKLNGITDPSSLKIGQVLKIP